MNFNMTLIAMLIKEMGVEAVRRAITISERESIRQAIRNKDEPQEMLDKRNAWVEATLDYGLEIANLDFD